ncbi:MAG: MoaD/ThiS family protein [Elusimicrobiota bacterium]
MKVRVLFFAAARQWAGSSALELGLPEGALVQDALRSAELACLAPRLSSIRLAVNERFAALDSPLHDGDELAVLPPVSGG